MLRRLKSDVENLPEKKETMLFVGLSDVQARLYRNIVTKNREALAEDLSEKDRVGLMNILMQVCCRSDGGLAHERRVPNPLHVSHVLCEL